MRRLVLVGLAFAAACSACVALTGCVVVAPRPHYAARAWVPGYYAPGGVWISGHWRG